METKDKNGKTYHWCTKQKMWTLHKASECTLEGSKDNNNNKEEEENKLQLKQVLSAMEDNDKLV